MSKLTIRDYYNDFISRTQNYKNMTFDEYKRLLSKYYVEVMNSVVEGNGVQLSNGLGILIIEYEDMSEVKKHNVIDWPATQRRKKEILIKPFSQTKPPENIKRRTEKQLQRYINESKTYLVNMAKWKAAEEYAKAGLSYDGVDCIVYKEADYKIRVMIVKPDISNTNDMCLVPTNTLPKETKGLTHKELAEKFTDRRLGLLKYNFRTRAEINMYRDKLNYLRYKHKMI